MLDTDDNDFGGFGRVAAGMNYPKECVPWEGRQQSIRLYLPNRTAQVLSLIRAGQRLNQSLPVRSDSPRHRPRSPSAP